MTVVCGDSHTSTHGAFACLAWGIGTSEVEHVLATQMPGAEESRRPCWSRCDGRLPRGVTAKDIALAVIGRIGTAGGTGYAIEFAGSAIRALSMEGRMTLCNMAIEAGARAGMVAVDDTTIDYLHGRPFAPQGRAVGSRGGLLAHAARATRARSSTRWCGSTPREIKPQVTWGTSPEMVDTIDGRVPDPAADCRIPMKRKSVERALEYMGLAPNTPITDIRIDKVFIGSCTNSRIEDLRAAAAVVKGRKVASSVKLAMVVPGSGLVKRQAEAEGLDRVFQRRRLRVARAGLLDVPGDERRPARAGRALRLDVQPQLRRAAGRGRPHASGQPGDGGGGRASRAVSSTSGRAF